MPHTNTVFRAFNFCCVVCFVSGVATRTIIMYYYMMEVDVKN